VGARAGCGIQSVGDGSDHAEERYPNTARALAVAPAVSANPATEHRLLVPYDGLLRGARAHANQGRHHDHHDDHPHDHDHDDQVDLHLPAHGARRLGGDCVVHHVDGSLNPAWVGGDQVRAMRFDGDRLVLSAEVRKNGQTVMHSLTWERC